MGDNPDVPCRVSVDYSHAGKAEHTVRVIGPSGHHVPSEVQETRDGQHVRFEPHEPGRYKIYITYGGLDVPGRLESFLLLQMAC